MGCKGCIINELRIDIQLAGERYEELLSDVIHFLNRSGALIKISDGIVTIRESGVREFMDFCMDHLNPQTVLFRIEGQGQEWRPLSEVSAILDMKWIDKLILKGSVESYLQPIVNRDREVYGYESLARFKREDGSLIYPNEVFAAAKKRGRLYALDRLCRMTAVKNAASIKNNAKIFINFIPTSIYSPEFCLRSTVELTNSLGIETSRFVFEVVETEYVDDVPHLKKILAYYYEKGFHYALDDVGEGYSTKEMLVELKPHYMKLDMSYVQGVAEDANKQATARSLLEKAVQIGSIPLAEGVECREDYDWLKREGYQLFQGYLFGKPEPVRYYA